MRTDSSSWRRGLVLMLCVIAVAGVIAWLVRDRVQPPESTTPPHVALAPEGQAPNELVLVASPAPARDAIASDVEVETAVEPTTPSVDSPTKGRLHGVIRHALEEEGLTGNVAVNAKDLWGEGQSVYCRPDGAYAFEDLAPGRYWLRVASLANGRADAVVDVTGDTTHDLHLSKETEVEVRVVDEIGKPVEVLGLLAVATVDEPGEWIEEVRGRFTDRIGVGRFIRPLSPASESPSEVLGQIALERDPPLALSLLRYQRVLETKRIEPGTKVVKFVLRTDDARVANGGIRLRAVDADRGDPIARVSALADGPGTRMAPARDGVCEFTDLMPGTYGIRLMAKDRGMVHREVLVPPGEIVDLGDVPMAESHWVSGRILDEGGVGRKSEIRFDACEADGRVGPNHGPILASATESDGTFRVTGLAPGFHRLEVVGKGGRAAECVAVFDVRDGPVENATLTVMTGVPFILDPNGKHGPDARFVVLDEKGMRIVSRLAAEPEPVRVRLAPGRYTVEFRSSRDDPDPRTSSFELVREPVVVRMR